jgi:Ca2+-transporting ATPase
VCSDKTGTLTENKLKCRGIYQNGLFEEKTKLNDRMLSLNIKLCNNAYKQENKYFGSPMEIALLSLLDDNNIKVDEYRRLEEKEFNSSRKMMSSLNLIDNLKYQFTKGAYDKIISKCKYIRINGVNKILTSDDIKKLNEQIDIQASDARRILAFAYKENCNHIEEDNMVFLGFITFLDPPREGVKEAIEKFNDAGVKTVMITGDYIKTAFAIGKELGIVSEERECISGEEIDNISDEKLAQIVNDKSIFARVSPMHKARIVTALKNNGAIVAMTGDGVNDAPSLKKADIGIAMGINGSDVAKEASDMILTDDNFTTIETAIEEGRTIYNNIKKSVLFLLASNFSEIIVMIAAIIFSLPLPLLAIHILIVNLLTDSIPALALGADCKDSDIMKEKPRNIKETMFSNGGLANTIIYGVLIAILTMIVFLIPSIQHCLYNGIKFNLVNLRKILSNEDLLLKSQTYAFVVLSLSELFYSLVVRNINKSIIRKDALKNKYLNLSILGGIILTTLMVVIPFIRKILKLSHLGIITMLMLVIISSSIIMLHELLYPIVSRETNKHLIRRKKT